MFSQAAAAAAAANNEDYFVSTLGDDTWDGTSQEHIEDTDIGPWRTLGHAVQRLRQIRPNPPTADSRANIILLPGTHFLSSTVSLGTRDSYLTVRSLDREEVRCLTCQHVTCTTFYIR